LSRSFLMESLTGFLTDLTGFLTDLTGFLTLSWTVSTVLDGQYRVQGTGYRVQGGEFEGRKKRGERGKKLLDNCWIIAGLLLNNCLLTPA